MNPRLLCTDIIEKALNYFGKENLAAPRINLEKSGVKMNGDIFENSEELAKALKSIFGDAAPIMERQIIEETSMRLNCDANVEMTFARAMRHLKKIRQGMP